MTVTAQQKISQLESLNEELRRLIKEFKQVTDHPDASPLIRQKGEQLYDLALTYEGIRDTDLTIDQWMGHYLLGAKAEVTRLLTEAVSMARIVSEPVRELPEDMRSQGTPSIINVEERNETIEGKSLAPLSRLSEILERSTTQCAVLLEELDVKVTNKMEE